MAGSDPRRDRRRRLKLVGWGTAPLALLAGLALVVNAPVLMWNRTSSEPIGLYVRTSEPPAPGRLVAFMAPPSAFPYADRRLGHLYRVPILKEIAAAEGDLVCTTGGSLRINGQWRAPILVRDRDGADLPRWSACRALARGEFFVFSARIPNSFDSRYFGPVTLKAIDGVFAPLLAFPDRSEAA